MKLEASNLGQILGRALYGALELRPQPELVAAAEAARRAEESRRALERERLAREEAARKAQERELDLARAAAVRREISASVAEKIGRREAKLSAKRSAMEVKRAAAPAANTHRRRGRVGELEALLKQRPDGLNLGEIKQALGVATHIAIKAIERLPIARLGRRRHYIYRLKQENA